MTGIVLGHLNPDLLATGMPPDTVSMPAPGEAWFWRWRCLLYLTGSEAEHGGMEFNWA